MQTVQKILMKWALENKDYYMAYILYNEYNVGIPNSLLYNLPSKTKFSSINDLMDSNNNISSQDKYLTDIFVSFRYSKYVRLPEWDNNFGYRLIKN